METDKRPFYIWIVVLLANIGMLLAVMSSRNLIPLGISLFLTIVPVLISRSKSHLKNRFGYGIPILFILPLPYFIYDYYTCTGKFCDLAPLFYGITLGLSAIIFALFYAIGVYARKWNVKFVLTLIWIEVILLIGLAMYFAPDLLNSFS